MSDHSRLIASIGSHQKNLWIQRFFLWGYPALYVFSTLFILSKLPDFFEYPLLNNILGVLAIFLSGLGMNRLYTSGRKIGAAVLLIYPDRVIFKTIQTKISVPRTRGTDVSLELLGGPLRLMRLQVGGYKKMLSAPNITPKFIQRAEEDGVRFIQSPVKGWLIFIVSIAALSFLFPVITFLKMEKINPDFFVALICLIALLKMKRQATFQTNTCFKRLFKRLFFTRYTAQSLACYLLMFALLLVASQPLSPVDRKLRGVHTLLKEGRFADANREFEMIESPERSERFKNNYAWFLAVVPDDELRNPKKAITLAQQALLQRDTKHTQDTLACAFMANGEVEKALEIAKESKLKDRIALFEQHELCKDSKFTSRSVASGK